jgi:predicted GNAT family acetyltransferase
VAFAKETIFNLALNALLLKREVSNADSDTSQEASVLRNVYDVALGKALADMDLTSTRDRVTLAVVETDPNTLWLYAYEYPTNCAFFRRIVTETVIDDRDTHEPKEVALYEGQKVIFCNKTEAVAEYIPNDLDIDTLNADAIFAIALMLAYMAAPLVVGKGARELRKQLMEDYKVAKAEAQETDNNESFSFVEESASSEFVKSRMS